MVLPKNWGRENRSRLLAVGSLRSPTASHCRRFAAKAPLRGFVGGRSPYSKCVEEGGAAEKYVEGSAEIGFEGLAAEMLVIALKG